MTRLTRALFGPRGRACLIALFLAALWLAWWKRPALPVATVRGEDLAGPGGSSWSNPPRGVERVVYCSSSQSEHREVYMDLGSAREHVLNSDGRNHRLSQWEKDLTWIALDEADGRLHIKDLSDLSSRLVIPPIHEKQSNENHYALTIAPGGRRIAVSPRAGAICQVWDIDTQHCILRLENVADEPAFSSDANRIALRRKDSSAVTIWDLVSGRVVAELPAAKEDIHCLSFAPDGRVLIGYVAPGSIQPWSPPTGGGVIMSDSIPGPKTMHLFLWNPNRAAAESLGIMEFQHAQPMGYRRVECSSDGSYAWFYGSTKNGFWDLTANPPRPIADIALTGPVPDVCFDPRSRLIGLNDDRGIRLLDHGSRQVVFEQASDTDRQVRLNHFSPQGRWIEVTEYQQQLPVPPWKRTLQKWLSLLFPASQDWRALVLDPADGRLVARLPANGIVAYDTDESHAWTYRQQDTASGGRQRIFEKWRLTPSVPPCWLLLLTVCSLGFTLFDLRRYRLRHRCKLQTTVETQAISAN